MTIPQPNVSREAMPWAKALTAEVKRLSTAQKRTEKNRRTTAATAASTLAAMQSATLRNQDEARLADARAQTDPTNLFDYTPIIMQDASLFGAEAMSGYEEGGGAGYRNLRSIIPNITAWYPDGFTIVGEEWGAVHLFNQRRLKYTGPVIISGRLFVDGPATPGARGFGFSLLASPFNEAGDRLFNDSSATDLYKLQGLTAFSPGTPDAWNGDGYYGDPSVTGRAVTPTGTPTNTDNGTSAQPAATWSPVLSLQFGEAGQAFTIRELAVRAVSGSVAWEEGAIIPAEAIAEDSIPGSKIIDLAMSKVVGLGTALGQKAALIHSHVIGDVTGLQAALDGKADTSALAGKANLSHTHAAADVSSGTFAAARLPQATETAIGALEIATAAEVTAGTDAVRAITPIRLKERLDALPAPTAALKAALFRDGSASIASAGWVKVPIDSMAADRLDTSHFTRTTNGVTVLQAGLYQIFIEIVFAASTGGNARFAGTFINNVESQMENGFRGTIPGFNLPATASGVRQLAANSTIELGANQNSGGALGFTMRRFGIVYLGP